MCKHTHTHKTHANAYTYRCAYVCIITINTHAKGCMHVQAHRHTHRHEQTEEQINACGLSTHTLELSDSDWGH